MVHAVHIIKNSIGMNTEKNFLAIILGERKKIKKI